jgi:hypothetical protein
VCVKWYVCMTGGGARKNIWGGLDILSNYRQFEIILFNKKVHLVKGKIMNFTSMNLSMH